MNTEMRLPQEVEMGLRQTQAKLRGIERRDWWLWGATIVVTLVLLVPVFSLTRPGLLKEPDPLLQLHLSQSVRGLLGMVLLFNLYTIYQQVLIKRLRWELAEKLYTIARLEVHAQEFQELALLDPLTGLYNRRFVEGRLVEELARSRRQGKPLSVLMLDLNEFKPINDRYGHGAGDTVLREFAKRLKQAIRISDLPVRMGGDEFLVLLPECTTEQAQHLLGRLGPLNLELPGATVSLTFAVGSTAYEPGEPPQQLLERADQALYLAKRESRIN